MKPMDKIVPSDIQVALGVRVDSKVAKDAARLCNSLRARHAVAVWELSLEYDRKLYFDGWDASGKEACHERIT